MSLSGGAIFCLVERVRAAIYWLKFKLATYFNIYKLLSARRGVVGEKEKKGAVAARKSKRNYYYSFKSRWIFALVRVGDGVWVSNFFWFSPSFDVVRSQFKYKFPSVGIWLSCHCAVDRHSHSGFNTHARVPHKRTAHHVHNENNNILMNCLRFHRK